MSSGSRGAHTEGSCKSVDARGVVVAWVRSGGRGGGKEGWVEKGLKIMKSGGGSRWGFVLKFFTNF